MALLQIATEELIEHVCVPVSWQPKLWSGLYKNKESIADLWLGLLRFYTEEFPFNERVVCIRRLAPLSKFEKLWNGCGIAIEDPFNLSHNLGSGLSRKSRCIFSFQYQAVACQLTFWLVLNGYG